ncbi:MAG: hypothetical protein U0Y08_00370 [Bacteroidia bacterium]
MKTTSIPNAVLTLVVAVFTTIQVNTAFATASVRTNAVRYNQTWIPSSNLDAVEISAARTNSTVVGVAEYKGALIPAENLAAVTIKATGQYTPEDVQPVTVEPIAQKGQRVEVRKVNGEFVPYMEMAPVTISATAQTSSETAVVEKAPAQTEETPVFTISARKTFDVLVNLVVDKVMDIVHDLLGSSGK